VQKPSAKNIILIAIAAAILGAAFIVSKYENSGYKANLHTTSNVPVVTASATSSDFGSYNIAYAGDWEKTLSTAVSGAWGSSATGSVGTSSAPLTPVDILGRDILTRYAQAKSSGQDTTDPTVQQAIAGQILSDGTILPSPKVYAKNNIIVTSNNSTSTIAAYSIILENAFKNDLTASGYETDILQNSLDNNDPSVLAQLNPLIANYQALIKDLLAVSVPSSAAALHVNLINGINEILFSDEAFSKMYSDPMTSLYALGEYKKGSQDTEDALLALGLYFKAMNIPVFASTT
jgi:hypothetical protein